MDGYIGRGRGRKGGAGGTGKGQKLFGRLREELANPQRIIRLWSSSLGSHRRESGRGAGEESCEM